MPKNHVSDKVKSSGLSIPDDLKQDVTRSAAAEGRSFSNYVCWILKKEQDRLKALSK